MMEPATARVWNALITRAPAPGPQRDRYWTQFSDSGTNSGTKENPLAYLTVKAAAAVDQQLLLVAPGSVAVGV